MIHVVGTELYETYNPVVLGVLQTCNQRHRFFSHSVDEDILCLSSESHSALDHVICKEHCHPHEEECEYGHEEIT